MQSLGMGVGRHSHKILLATGQTTSYGSGTGVDDGAYRKGVGKNYTVLTTGAYAGNTNITINSKTDAHANACVVDNRTGLMWSRTYSASVGPASDGKIPWTTTGAGATAEGIFPYCAAANAASLAGYTDWRIPNINELLSIADHEAVTCVPDAAAFPGWSTAALGMLSSTTITNDTTACEQYNFINGTIVSRAKTTALTCVLVRGG